MTIDSNLNICKAGVFITSSHAQAGHFHMRVLCGFTLQAGLVFVGPASTSHPLIRVLWFLFETRDGDPTWGTVWAGRCLGSKPTARQAEPTRRGWAGPNDMASPLPSPNLRTFQSGAPSTSLFLNRPVLAVLWCLRAKGAMADTDTGSRGWVSFRVEL